MILFPLFINTSVDWKKFDRAADSTVSMVVRWFHSWTFSAHGSVDEQWKAFITLKCVIVLIHQRLSLRGKTLRKNNKDDVQCPNNRLCEACLNCSWTLWDLTRWRNYENPVPGRQTGDHLCYTSWGAVTVNHHSVWSPPPHHLLWSHCGSFGSFPAATMKRGFCLWYISYQGETRTSSSAWDCKTCSSRIVWQPSFAAPLSRCLIEVCDKSNTIVCVCIWACVIYSMGFYLEVSKDKTCIF